MEQIAWTAVDTAVLAIYLLGMLYVGFYYSKVQETTEDFFLAGRSVGYVRLAASVLSTDLGGGFTIGLAGLGFAMGLSGSWLMLTGLIGCFAVAKFMIPKAKTFGDTMRQFTLPDYFAARYDRRSRLLASIITFFANVTFVGTQIVAGAHLAKAVTGLPLETCTWIFGVLVIAYTAMGGFNAVVTTDLIQWIIMAVGIFLIGFPRGLAAVGGIAGLKESLPPEMMSLTNVSLVEVGAWMLSIVPAWFVSMTVWQRVFAAKDERTAKNAYITTGFFEWPLFAFVGAGMGMIAKALYPEITNAEAALPHLLTNILPVGLTGLVLAAYIAAVMSTSDSCLIVSVATVTRDIYQSFINPDAEEKTLLTLSKVLTIVLGVASLAVALYFPFVLKLLLYGYSFQAAVFFPLILGLYWKGATAEASFYSLLIGGIGSLGWAVAGNPFGLDPIYFGMPVTLVLMLVISAATKHSSAERLDIFFKDGASENTTLQA